MRFDAVESKGPEMPSNQMANPRGTTRWSMFFCFGIIVIDMSNAGCSQFLRLSDPVLLLDEQFLLKLRTRIIEYCFHVDVWLHKSHFNAYDQRFSL